MGIIPNNHMKREDCGVGCKQGRFLFFEVDADGLKKDHTTVTVTNKVG